jgi:hypothetical protein
MNSEIRKSESFVYLYGVSAGNQRSSLAFQRLSLYKIWEPQYGI